MLEVSDTRSHYSQQDHILIFKKMVTMMTPKVMWRMLTRRPLTRLGRLARARTHEDILELADA